MTKLCFIDTETTGLDPDRHDIWEVGAIIREPNGDESAHHWFLNVDLGTADPFALKVGGYHDRHPGAGPEWRASPKLISGPYQFAAEFAWLTRGAHLVGNVVSFDEERLRRLLQRSGACPEWHYHLIDVESMIAGKLGIVPPWSSKDLSVAIGVDPLAYEQHTALGDARWARDEYDAVMAQ